MSDAAPVGFDFGKKKKKRSTKKSQPKTEAVVKAAEPAVAGKTETGGDGATASPSAFVDPALELAGDATDYSYDELHTRVFELIHAARPSEKVVYKMKPPVVYREGTKKTVWVNFAEICRIMHREEDHVLSFVLAELGTSGSLDGNRRLVLKGRFQPKHIEVILRHYISEYVKCHTCKSPETILKKENRLLFMECEKCKSVRSVAGIQAGFKATTRAARRAARG